MKLGRRNFLKGLGSAAAVWMVKPELEDPTEEGKEDIEQTFVEKWPEDCCHCKQYCDSKCPNYSWPISCDACDRYACHRDCPRHATNPYRFCFSYGDTFRSLEEQQERRARKNE